MADVNIVCIAQYMHKLKRRGSAAWMSRNWIVDLVKRFVKEQKKIHQKGKMYLSAAHTIGSIWRIVAIPIGIVEIEMETGFYPRQTHTHTNQLLRWTDAIRLLNTFSSIRTNIHGAFRIVPRPYTQMRLASIGLVIYEFILLMRVRATTTTCDALQHRAVPFRVCVYNLFIYSKFANRMHCTVCTHTKDQTRFDCPTACNMSGANLTRWCLFYGRMKGSFSVCRTKCVEPIFVESIDCSWAILHLLTTSDYSRHSLYDFVMKIYTELVLLHLGNQTQFIPFQSQSKPKTKCRYRGQSHIVVHATVANKSEITFCTC